MQMLVMMLMIMAIAAGINTFPRARLEQVSEQAGAIASQLTWHHNQAVRICSIPNPPCPSGIVAVPVAARQPGSAVDAGGYFQSGTDGNLLATTWVPSSIAFARAPMAMSGAVAVALRAATRGSVYSGYWNATTQTVNGSTTFDYRSSTGHYEVAIPPGFGGLSLTDGAPLSVTRTQ